MEIVKYNKYKKANVSSVGSSGSSSNNSSTTSSSNSSTGLSRSIWGNEDTGNDITNSMLINGNIYVNGYDIDSELDDDDNDGKEKSDSEIFPPDNEVLDGSIYASGGIHSKSVETNEAYIKQHLYVNHTHSEHKGDKVCLIGEVETNTQNIKKNTDNIAINKTNIETNKTNIASNLSEINALKTRVSTNETNIANNTTAINSLDTNLQIAEQSIKNNSDEIVALKNRTTANETAISSLLPIGSIIMYNGLMSEIPEGWAICNGENGTPNLIGKFVKAWTESGQTGGNNSIKLKKTDIPKVRISMNTETFDEYKQMESYQYLNKQIPMLDKVEEGVYDEGGSSHYSLYTGYKKGDNGLVGVPVKEYIMASANFLQAGEEKEYQTSVDIEPSYYSLIYICRIA